MTDFMLKENMILGLILVAITGLANDTSFYIAAALSISLGFCLRVGLDISNNSWTFKKTVIQFIITIPICFVAYNIYESYSFTMKIQIYLFAVSFFSVFIAGVIDKMGKIGFTTYARYLLGKVLADTKEEEKL
jgi:hypothetical protein